MAEFERKPEYHRRRTAIEELERKHTRPEPDPDRALRFPQLLKPFGMQHDRWAELKAMIEPGDELWEYCSDQRSWNAGRGRAGIQLIRNGNVVADLMGKFN